jgi:hypothetical protein
VSEMRFSLSHATLVESLDKGTRSEPPLPKWYELTQFSVGSALDPGDVPHYGELLLSVQVCAA